MITRSRRFEAPSNTRVKWIAEFSYPVDSRKNPMVQISDLVVYCARRFLELDAGYRDSWPEEAKRFYSQCFAVIDDRIVKKSLVPRPGRDMRPFDSYLESVRATPRRRWKSKYKVS